MVKIQFTFKDVTVTEELKKYAEEKFKKLEKHFEKEVLVRLIFKKENNSFKVEAEVKEGPFSAFASETAGSLEAGLDAVVEEIQRQLHRQLDKVRDKKREQVKWNYVTGAREEAGEQDFEYKVMKPEVYSLEDARLLLDDYGGAIVFINQDTGKVAVLHRTAKGKVELIEIDL